MDKQLTPKQEKFVYNYIQGGVASVAYKAAYGAASPGHARKLLDDPRIIALIDTLRKEAYAEHIETVGSITAELNEARLLAKSLLQPAVMVKATMDKAKLHGLLVERLEVSTVDTVGILEARIANVERLRPKAH